MTDILTRNADKIDMFLNTPDYINAWNTAIAVRKGVFVLDYTTHHPKLHISARNAETEVWQIMDTRRKRVDRLPLKDQTLGLLALDITDRLAKLGACLTFAWEQNKQKQKRAKLQLRSVHSRTYAATLAEVRKGEIKSFGEFELTDKW